jgi:hypothetical protein
MNLSRSAPRATGRRGEILVCERPVATTAPGLGGTPTVFRVHGA